MKWIAFKEIFRLGIVRDTIMDKIIFPPRMYSFLWAIRECELKKKILDCGAGGRLPPLAIFHERGFETYGVDISDKQIEKALAFSKDHGINLNIMKGDMRSLDFDDDFFSHVYSQNSIFHLTKKDTETAMQEMKRTLCEGGYMYVNFLSVDDQGYGEGEEAGPGEWIALERDEPTLHSFYTDDEPDSYFEGMEILYKIKKTTDIRVGDYTMVILEYIAKKK